MARESTRLRTVLERLATELKDEESREELDELRDQIGEGHRLTYQDLLDVIAEAPPEERAKLRALLADELEDDDVTPPPTPPKKKKGDPEPPPNDDPAPPSGRRTRPGRRSGQAYDWAVDEETGQVVKAPMAYIYSGDDEPEEVELMPETTREAEEGAGDE